MSDKDKALIDKAYTIPAWEWDSISKLIEQAESPRAKEELRIIKNRKYHIEECRCGCD